MIVIMERLIANGHAYAAQGHVLFDVPSMPDYGRLANKGIDEQIARLAQGPDGPPAP